MSSMAPRLSLRPVARTSCGLGQLAAGSGPSNICLFCSLSSRTRPNRSRQKTASPWTTTRRSQSTIAPPATPESSPNTARSDLQEALHNLQKHAPNYINLSRIQLALRNLSQPPGQESVRVAVLGMTTGTTSAHATAKKLLRLLLADPLQPDEEWKQQLQSAEATEPLILHVGSEREKQEHPHLSFTKRRNELLPEVNVSSPVLDGNNLEILLMETNPFDASPAADLEATEETVLVPTVDIPSNTGRYTPVSTPVHRAVVVGDGILGAASLVSAPLLQEDSMISAVVNLPAFQPTDDPAAYPFTPISLPAATQALSLFRASVTNAGAYERLWHKSNLPSVARWLKTGVLSSRDPAGGPTKPAVRSLITSILRNASASVQAEEARLLAAALTARVSPAAVAGLDGALAAWAQAAHAAHAELQSRLDAAFAAPRRRRRLAWWRLFWRVDDVAMLAADVLALRFLPDAERAVIYLAGRIREAGLAVEPTYPPPPPVVPAGAGQRGNDDVADEGEGVTLSPELQGKWPTHIPHARAYLLDRTAPALQALAQRLVAQAVGTSAATASLAALTYVSHVGGAGAYEAGAVAALGVVWSLRRLQARWEAARAYWQDEVREEGRRAVRSTEASVAEVLDRAGRTEAEAEDGALEDVRRVRRLVEMAEEALQRLR